MTIFLNDLPSKESVMENMQKMNSFGSRLTGTKGQNAYTAWLKDEIAKMGYDVVDKQYTFKKWEATDWSLTVDGQNIDVSSPFPYSGLTDEKGVTGKLVTVFNNPLDFQRARGKIAVCRIKNLSKISSKKNLRNERTRIRETGAFFTEKGQRPARPCNRIPDE